MLKQTMIALMSAAAIGAGFAGSADAASFNFEWNVTDSQGFALFELTGMVDGDLGADGKVRNLSNLMATFGDPFFSEPLSFDIVTDPNSFFALDGSDVSVGFGGTSFVADFGNGPEVVDGTTSLVAMQDLLAGTFSAAIDLDSDSALGGISISINTNISDCNNGEFTCSFVAAEKTVEDVPEPASLLGLAAIGAVTAGGALKKKAA